MFRISTFPIRSVLLLDKYINIKSQQKNHICVWYVYICFLAIDFISHIQKHPYIKFDIAPNDLIIAFLSLRFKNGSVSSSIGLVSLFILTWVMTLNKTIIVFRCFLCLHAMLSNTFIFFFKSRLIWSGMNLILLFLYPCWHVDHCGIPEQQSIAICVSPSWRLNFSS